MEEFLRWLIERSESDVNDLIEEFGLDRDMTRAELAELVGRLFDIGVEV